MNENEQLDALESTANALTLEPLDRQRDPSAERTLRTLLTSPVTATKADVQHVLAFAERATSGDFGLAQRLQCATAALEYAVEVAHQAAPGVLHTRLLLTARETVDRISRPIFPPAHLHAIAQGIDAAVGLISWHYCRVALVEHSGILQMMRAPARQLLEDADRVDRLPFRIVTLSSPAGYAASVADRDQEPANEEHISRRLGWVLLGQSAPMTAAQLRDWFDEHHPRLRANGQRAARVLRALGESRMAGCAQIQFLMHEALWFSGATRIVDDLWDTDNILFDLAMEIEQGA